MTAWVKVPNLGAHLIRNAAPGTIFFGYVITAPMFAHEFIQYAILNAVSFFAAAVASNILSGRVSDYIPTIIVFVVFIAGCFLKMYSLCFLYINRDIFGSYLIGRFPLEYDIISDSGAVLEYFYHITIYIVLIAVFVVFSGRVVPRKDSAKCVMVGVGLRAHLIFGVAIVILAAAVMYAIWYFEIGTVAATGEPPLPFRLAGVIAATNSFLLPMAFLSLIMVSNQGGYRRFSGLAVAAFALHGIATGLITTSRVPIATVWVSLLIMWIIQGGLTRSRVIGLAITLLLILGYSRLLGILRITTAADVDGLASLGADAFSELRDENAALGSVLQIADVVFRVGGADSYLNIIGSNISHSFVEAVGLVAGIPENATQYFNREVLGYDLPQIGTSFSPSLLGYFYIVASGVFGVSVLLILFLSLWQFIYAILRSGSLVIGPAAISVTLVTLAFYASEGTLESFPMRIGILAVSVIMVEVPVRLLMRTGKGAAQ